MKPRISVIIVAKSLSPYLRECIRACLANTFRRFEIIVVTDIAMKERFPKTRSLCFGPLGPAQKRDKAAKAAAGEILAFIDDDAYPSQEWLRSIVRHYADGRVAGACGPGVTPPGVSWQEEASGWVSASPIGSGGFAYRFLPARARLVDDYPSMNLSVRKSDFLRIGGFDSTYWPGEDTKLCLDLTHGLKKKIVYDPQALVYHHRRPLWIPHLKQNGNFGIHRGYFARVLPKTSARPIYFAPTALVALLLIYVAGSAGQVIARLPEFSMNIMWMIEVILGWYAILLLANAVWIGVRSKSIFQAIVSVPAVFITHLWYGIRVLQGFLFTATLRV